MLGQERGAIFAAPHVVLFPDLAIMLTVLGFNLLGDSLRDVLDPRTRTIAPMTRTHCSPSMREPTWPRRA